MCILLIGGDKLGNIDKNLLDCGFREIIHMDGRKYSTKKQQPLPQKADVIVVLTDYINHNTSTFIKKEAKKRSIPVIFSKRSWSCLMCKIQSLKLA